MPEHTSVHRAVRDIKAGVRRVAKSSPVIAVGDALALTFAEPVHLSEEDYRAGTRHDAGGRDEEIGY